MKRNYAKNAREVCWDLDPLQEIQRVSLQMHKPVKKDIVMTLDQPWEGNCSGYLSIMKHGDTFRLYYRGSRNGEFGDRGKNGDESYKATACIGLPGLGRGTICMLESKDGKHFTRPELHNYDVEGCESNNIVYTYVGNYLDNFSVFYDTNPDCPADAKFKAIGARNRVKNTQENLAFYENHDRSQMVPGLMYFKSADGIRFEEVKHLELDGAFDSYNLAFWDEKTQQYFLYERDDHTPAEGEPRPAVPVDRENFVRDIKVTVSKDFENWTLPTLIDCGEEADIYQYYTNHVQRYYRADNMFLGIPTRYLDRNTPEQYNNFKYLKLPGHEDARLKVIQYSGREGSAITDAILMTSRDGFRFDRTDEAFMTPGIQNGSNWIYGDCFFAYGMAETESDIPGEPNEISLYMGEGYRTRNVDIRRYTMRLDGFFSWYADYKGGSVQTKPFTFEGDALHINFETSGRGYVRIRICDENGEPIEGYNSGLLFGNDVDRNVDFEKPISQLNGKTVSMRIDLGDAHLYSYMFC